MLSKAVFDGFEYSVLGDLNLPDIDCFYYHAANNTFSEHFVDFVNAYGLTQFVNQPTRNNNSLDLVLCSSSSFASYINVLPPISTSDHYTILLRPNVPTNINMHHNETPNTFFDYAHADFDSLNNYLFTVDWNTQFLYCFDVDEWWTTFSKILTDGINCFVPQVSSSKHIKNRNRCRYPHFIRLMLNCKAVLWKAWKISLLDKDKEVYTMLAERCTQAIYKYLAAKELEMVRKSNLGSFYNFVN
jgi:hypothetical protein